MPTRIPSIHEQSTPVRIPLGEIGLQANLRVPTPAIGLVIFVHGSGSSRFSPRNMHLAAELNEHGIATLLLDLLTPEEQKIDSETMEFRFNIPLLAARATAAVRWALDQPETSHLPVGLFGASTGAAAALVTASVMKNEVAAIVSRGGRPDLADETLEDVLAPTLLVVGGEDKPVLALNRQAMPRIPAISQLHVVPGATHLFEEPGAMEEVAKEAVQWFEKYLHPVRTGKAGVA